jgi:hypothetical protein
VIEAGVYDAPAGTALVLTNFTYRPIEALTVRLPLTKPLRGARSVEHGPLGFTEEPASQALRGQGYGSVAVFTTRLGLNDIILLESLTRSGSLSPSRLDRAELRREAP